MRMDMITYPISKNTYSQILIKFELIIEAHSASREVRTLLDNYFTWILKFKIFFITQNP